MQALTFKRYGKSPDVGFAEVHVPRPKPDELLVEVHAVGLNPIDNAIPTGRFKPILRFELPATIGSDLAGVVKEVGSRVTRFKPGDAIFASLFDLGNGSLAEFATVPEQLAAPMPANLSFVEAASLPMVALTSWQALKERADVQPGQEVFIPAGSGGVGSFAIQLAKVLGARVATTASTSNVEWVRKLGADEVIDYKQREFNEVLHDQDVVFNTVGGGTGEKEIAIIKPGGKVISITGPLDAAFASARGLNFVLRFVFGLMGRKVRRLAAKQDASYSFLFVRPDGGQLREVGDLLATQRIRPVIDKVYPFLEARDALAYVATGRAKGKVVVQLKPLAR